MKKTFIALFAITMIGGTIVSCKKDKKDCSAAIKKAADAAIAFGQEHSIDNCNTYKAAIHELLEGDCAGSISAEQKTTYQEALDDLDCDPR
ncbi:MAG: hypothetical protein J0H29_07725 [Sphingobacteriales bacterium]|nr:hypothetical protein [Sphingobacteriales bacterium]OJY87622.1 MAG: hypothetical protein BGP14_12985 [Sphingobacteriales bacterium 44-15]